MTDWYNLCICVFYSSYLNIVINVRLYVLFSSAGYIWNSDSIYCSSDGFWKSSTTDSSSLLGSCIPTICSQPLSLLPTNAESNGDCISGVKTDISCSIQCKQGYQVVGNPYQCSKKITIINNRKIISFQFEGQQSCQIITSTTPTFCPALTSSLLPANSEIGSCNSNINVGSSCSLSCPSNYQLIGNLFRCVLNGDNTVSLQGNQQCQSK